MESKTKVIVMLSIISFFSFTLYQTKPYKTGKEIFESNCARCHGTDGAKGRWGAKNLTASILSDTELFSIITNGKRIMPAWGESLSQHEISSVIDYIKTLRKH